MKKFTILSLFAAFMLVGMAANAQEQGDIRVNGGLQYLLSPYGSSDGSQLGFGAGGEYVFADAMSGALSYYTSEKDGLTTNLLSIDYRYYFMTDDIQVFGQAGFTSLKVKIAGASATGSSLNFGAGAIFGLSDNLGIETVLRYDLVQADFGAGGDAVGLGIRAGISYSF